MKTRVVPVLSIFVCIAAFAPAVFGADKYRLPPQAAIDVLDIPPPPAVSVSPDGKWMVLTTLQGMPTMADRAVPMARLGGVRVNVKTTGPYDIKAYDLDSSYTGAGTAYSLTRLSDRSQQRVDAPDRRLGPPLWAPDSAHFAFLRTTESGIELWVVDVASAKARKLSEAQVNAARSIDLESDAPCVWMPDSTHLLCHFVAQGRGAAPQAGVPAGPVTQESDGIRAPVWTFTNLLTRPFDEELFDYYMTSQPTLVSIDDGSREPLGKPAVYQALRPSADAKFFLAVRLVRPYSYLVPATRFPKVVEVLGANGEPVRTVAELPIDNSGPGHLGWAPAGARDFAWRPGVPAALTYIEALDGGNPKQAAEFRDRVMLLKAPFDASPVELLRTRTRIAGAENFRPNGALKFWEKGGYALVTEFDWATRDVRTWRINSTAPQSKPALVWSYSRDDWYGQPGTALLTINKSGQPVIRQDGDWIYLGGEGGSPDGDHPFLDRYNIKSRKTERLFRGQGASYEQVVALLDNKASRIVTRRETEQEPPNVHLRDLKQRTQSALTDFTRPKQALAPSHRERVNYVRKDGVELSGELYLPPGHRPGERLPVFVWAYPREYANKQGAGQVRGSSYRYAATSPTAITDYMLFLTQGYAVMADAAMPIVGGLEANDTYVEQLVANAQAVADKLVDMGVADRSRIGVGGLSYGAFMTANLLTHSDVFATGVAINGAYNRTLTPFGFQSERRTYWEAPDIYKQMSAFLNADKLKHPIMLVYGEIDSNTGTYPIQSERLYHALKGLGAKARLVQLPYEDHLMVARESRLHTLAEMFDWFDRYVKRKGTDEVRRAD